MNKAQATPGLRSAALTCDLAVVKQMLDDGLITPADDERKKAQLLSDL